MGIRYIRLSLQRPRELLLRQLQERLLQESTTRIEDGRCQGRVWEPLGDLVKRRVDAIAVSDISADANGLAAAGGNLLHDGVIVVRVACKHYNRIRLGKAPRNRRTLVHVRLAVEHCLVQETYRAGANAGDNCKFLGSHSRDS